MLTIADVPDEILKMILSNLSSRDINLRGKQVASRWNAISNEISDDRLREISSLFFQDVANGIDRTTLGPLMEKVNTLEFLCKSINSSDQGERAALLETIKGIKESYNMNFGLE